MLFFISIYDLMVSINVRRCVLDGRLYVSELVLSILADMTLVRAVADGI